MLLYFPHFSLTLVSTDMTFQFETPKLVMLLLKEYYRKGPSSSQQECLGKGLPTYSEKPW